MTNYISPKSKLYSHLDTIQAIKDYERDPVGLRPAPVNIEVDFSNRCDLHCQGCHFSYTHTRGPWAGNADKPQDFIAGGDLMDYDLAISMIDQISTYGVKGLTITGGGEPTLHQRFDDIVAHAHDVGLDLGIYTHGGFIRGDRAAWMKRHFKWVYFSLDACTVESYKKYKGVNRFERVCDNISNLAALPGDATVGVGFLLGESNWHEIHDMVKLGRELGAGYVQFRPMVHFSQDAPGELVEDTSWVKSALGHLNVYANDKFVIADATRFQRYAGWTGHGYSTCFWAAIQTVITPNGKVWRCTNKREHPDALLGDLSLESFQTLWNRSGGACGVGAGCRVACRGDLSNQQLTPMMATDVAHANFV